MLARETRCGVAEVARRVASRSVPHTRVLFHDSGQLMEFHDDIHTVASVFTRTEWDVSGPLPDAQFEGGLILKLFLDADDECWAAAWECDCP